MRCLSSVNTINWLNFPFSFPLNAHRAGKIRCQRSVRGPGIHPWGRSLCEASDTRPPYNAPLLQLQRCEHLWVAAFVLYHSMQTASGKGPAPAYLCSLCHHQRSPNPGRQGTGARVACLSHPRYKGWLIIAVKVESAFRSSGRDVNTDCHVQERLSALLVSKETGFDSENG